MNIYSLIGLLLVMFAAFIGYWCAKDTIEEYEARGEQMELRQAARVYTIGIGSSIVIVMCFFALGDMG